MAVTAALPRRWPHTLPRLGLGHIWVLGLAVLILAPLGGLGLLAAQPASTLSLPADYLRSAVVHTIAITLATAVVAGTLGTLAAWCVVMYRFPGRGILSWALILPFAVPAYVGAYGLAVATEPLGLPVRTPLGMVLVYGLAFMPYVYVSARAAFISQSVCAFEAARALGATPLRAFWHVALPMARPAIVAGMALVMMETVADYGVAAYFGVPTLAGAAMRAWLSYGDLASAARVAVSIAALAGLLLLLERHGRGHSRVQAGRIWRCLNTLPLRGTARFGVPLALWGIIGLGFVLPVAVLALQAERHTPPWDDSLQALINSICFATLGAIVAVGMALLVLQAHGRAATLIGRLARLGYAVPGTALAVGLIGVSTPLWALTPAHSTASVLLALAILLYAYGVRFLAAGTEPIEAGLHRLSPSATAAARTLGASASATFWRIRLPAAQSALWAALALVFVDILKELPATLILRPSGLESLATLAYNFASDERLGHAAWPALLLVAAACAPVMWVSWHMDRTRPGA